jgi:glucose-6-phosphate 1-epimerase
MERLIAESMSRFEIPDTAQIVEGSGGLSKVRVTSSSALGEMYLHGAHVTSWKPAGTDEVLFVSTQSRWEKGHAIRGGVPVCFPWFADKADDPHAPPHGFVRTKPWQLESITQALGTVTVSMFTESNEDTRKWWPAEFRMVHRATFGAQLSLELVVMNTGTTPLRFEEALHAYLRVGNIKDVRVHGLDKVHYLDKTDSNSEKIQHGELMIASETDRIYLTGDAIELHDPVLHRRSRITKENSLTTVVWNPWVTKAHSLSDLAYDEWMQLICLETSNVSDVAVHLAPGQQHTMKSVVSVSAY